jgi:crossover junction endodeoxyribonuclease RuvC
MRQDESNGSILGIDPGSHNCGYGIVGSDGRYITSGTIVLSSKKPLHERLRELYEGLREIIGEYEPYDGIVEKMFFAKSVRSALSLGHARGVALLAVADGGLGFYEYTPVEVKKAVVGYGRADKKQVQEMVKNILGINTNLSPDGADALALTICHINHQRFQKVVDG